MNRIIFFLGILLIGVTQLPAQSGNRIIRGVVTDAANAAPLEGVLIVAKASNLESGSLTDGVFTIPISEKDSLLVFRFEEYETKEIRLTDDNEVNVVLHKATTPGPKLVLEKLTGNWRGLFAIRPGVEVPFQFRIAADGAVSLLNGEEVFPAGQLKINDDSFYIPLPLFDNELVFTARENGFTGVLRRQDLRGNATIVSAEKGNNYRFIETGSTPVKDLSGNYDVVFLGANGKEEKAVGIFKQKGNKLSATFLRVTGDSRYLEGTVEHDRIHLSAFIGSTPAYYTASITADGSLKGESVNTRGSVPFTAIPNAHAALPDAYTLTRLKEKTESLSFSFPDTEGKTVSITDPKFAGKPLIISIGGTWCPNCMDEAAFLGPWYEKNKSRGIELIGLQYERQTDAPYVKKVLERFKKQYGLQYTLLLGGVADKQAVVESLPALQNFVSFPTTLFIDRKGKVTKIHTGFSGPATGEHYTAFIKEFNEEVDRLLQ